MEKVALKNGVNKAVLGAKMPQTFTERVQIQEKLGKVGWSYSQGLNISLICCGSTYFDKSSRF